MKLIPTMLLAAAPLLVAAAPAAPAVTLAGSVKVEKVQTVNGRQVVTLAAPKPVFPGDHLVLATSYRNAGAKPVEKFVVTNPIPRGVAYLGDAGANAQVSVDGGRTWGALAALQVRTPLGQLRPAQAEDVTQVRWTIPVIAPGGSGTVQYRGVVQ